MKYSRSRRKRSRGSVLLLLLAFLAGFSLVLRSFCPLDSVEPAVGVGGKAEVLLEGPGSDPPSPASCATVEEMGAPFGSGWESESLRVRQLIQDHFALHGTARVRELPPEQFCQQGFVMGKASEAGFGNEMYKILTAAALSVVLNRSLIIGQTRGKYPFGDYVCYTNQSFTLKEVKHLWKHNDCVGKYGRQLYIRTDDFEKPTQTNILCSDWKKWKQPIIWFDGTTDAVGIQFLLKNIHPAMRKAASILYGSPDSLQSRPNVFGELMHFVISPSRDVEDAVQWVLNGGPDPHVTLHMRMMMNRPVRAVHAAVKCTEKALQLLLRGVAKPRIVLVSDTPSFIQDIKPHFIEFAEVLHFDYKSFRGNISESGMYSLQQKLGFRARDWGPAPRWVTFVDFFLASRAKHAVITGAHRRVGTTYAQLIAGLAAAKQLGGRSQTSVNFSFFSSFHSNLLVDGLRSQVGWGHVWNRFAGPLSCHGQPNQCALTPLLPSAWWDSPWQSPIPRDMRRLQNYGIQLSESGEVNDAQLTNFCKSRRDIVRTIPAYRLG